MAKRLVRYILLIAALVLPALGVSLPVLAADPTTEVLIVKYALDGTTVVNETTIGYLTMESTLPVQGDGVTHYYHQGPVFDETMDKWDPEETTNFKDKGAVRGTDIADLCDLVGGMEPGDTVVIRAIDGYNIQFGYENVYEPQDRQGPIVLCWYKVDDGTLGQNQEAGYPPRYFEAMQIVFMAKTTSPDGKFVFGNWDMHECLPGEAQHFYSELYPSTNGLSMKWASEIAIYPQGAPIVTQTGATPTQTSTGDDSTSGSSLPLIVGLSVAAVVVLLGVVIVIRRRR